MILKENKKDTTFTRARIQLILKSPFFSSLVMNMLILAGGCKTACINRDAMLYNASWVATLTEAQKIGLLVHEVLHLFGGDLFRRGSREKKLWNAACDYIINLQVIDAGYELPEGALLDDKFRGMSKEQVYQLLKDDRAQKQQNGEEYSEPENFDEHNEGRAQPEQKQDDSTNEDGKNKKQQSKKNRSQRKDQKTKKSDDNQDADSGDQPQDDDQPNEADNKESGETSKESGEKSDDQTDQPQDSNESGDGESDSDDSDSSESDEDEDGAEETDGDGDGDESEEENSGAPQGFDEIFGQDESDKELEEHWNDVAMKAATAGKLAGNLPDGFEKIFAESEKVETPLEELLAGLVSEIVRDDYSDTMFDRRFVNGDDAIMLADLGVKKCDIICAADVSGSIAQSDVQRFVNLIHSLSRARNLKSMQLYTFNTNIILDKLIETEEDIPETFQISGGTDFRPLFQKIEDDGVRPTALFILTDCCGAMPDVAPDYPVIWVTLPYSSDAPFGLQVEFSDAAKTE